MSYTPEHEAFRATLRRFVDREILPHIDAWEEAKSFPRALYTRAAEVGLLKREKRGNQQVYSADASGPIFTELASILRKTSGLADVLVQALAPVATQLRVAFVFGSVAQGRETSGSDIDVMLIGDISFRQAVQLLHPTQAVLGREVNPKLFSTTEFSAKAPTEPFLADVLAKPKLFLIGNAHDLEELARHQP